MGHVHITSGDDVFADLDFDCGFLKAPEDIAVLTWAYKRTREYARRLKCYRGVYVEGHPKFSKDSPAFASENDTPVAADAPDIVYSAEDEHAIEEYIRIRVQTCGHSLGTCSMQPRVNGGVVDSKLNVYGIEGLKVADMSIAPGNVASNTYSSALVIGEKAAVIIAEELNILNI